MTTPALIGHPDWLQYNASPLPVLVAKLGPLSAGTFTPETVNCIGGGAYMIVVVPTVPTDAVSVDIGVLQYDINDNFMCQDYFGAVSAGTGINIGAGSPCATIIRGNIYGPTFKIYGQVASSTWMDTVFSQLTFTTTTATLYVYVLPQGLGDPEPKLSCGAGLIPSGAQIMPGGLLMTWPVTSVAESSSYGPWPCCPYSGPAVLNFQCSGASTTAIDFIVQLNFYTVSNGTGTIAVQTYRPSAVSVPNNYDVQMPQMLCQAVLTNNNATQGSTFIGTLSAAASA